MAGWELRDLEDEGFSCCGRRKMVKQARIAVSTRYSSHSEGHELTSISLPGV